MKTLFCNILFSQGQGILIRGELDPLDRGVYNYHFLPPQRGGEMSGSWGRKRPWRERGMKGEEKEGEKGKRNDE